MHLKISREEKINYSDFFKITNNFKKYCKLFLMHFMKQILMFFTVFIPASISLCFEIIHRYTNVSNCLNVCFADDVVSTSYSKLASEDEQSESDENEDKDEDDEVTKKVREVYTDILKYNLKYDPKCQVSYEGEDLINSMRKDCDYVEKNHKGVCRHFSCYLIKKLRAEGIEAYPLYIKGENGYAHQAVLYKFGEKLLVADITDDIVAIGHGNVARKEDPWAYKDNLIIYILYMKEENKAYRFYYLDVDITDENVDLSSSGKVAEKVKILYEEERKSNWLKRLFGCIFCMHCD